jgi:hypothetical protein
MKTTILILAAASSAALASEHWPVREQETIQKTFRLSGEPMRVVVDNIDGYVHVKGYSGSEVHVIAHKSIRADTDSDLRQAKSEVQLQMTEQPGSVSIYYDAPWRCDGDRRPCEGDHSRRFYTVSYDIDLEMPKAARAVLSTINGGDVRLEDTTGDFEVKDINGGIYMTAIAGSGDVQTINGPVTIRFVRNPQRDCTFKTLNGPLDVYFQPGISADLTFKTFNGEIFSDFDVAPRPLPVSAVEHKNGKYVYRSHRINGGRIGNGGPVLNFDAFNGNIRLHEAGK